MERDDLMWLAGWLEGEGSFVWDGLSNLLIVSGCVDRDTVEKACRIMRSELRNRPPSENWGKKIFYHTRVSGPKAKELMERLFPFMSVRRQGQITEALAGYDRRNKHICISFDPSEVDEIRRSYLNGPQAAIEYGVSVSTIYNIRKYKGRYKKAEQ